MNASSKSPEKAANLPVVVPDSASPGTMVSKSALASICTALAPLALEAACELTRRWLSGTIAHDKKQNNRNFRSSLAPEASGLRRRRCGKRT